MDPVTKTLLDTGVLDETQLPFDESQNKAPDLKPMPPTLPITVKLNDPIVMGSDTVSEITISHVPKVAHCMHLPLIGEQKFGHYVPIVAHSCGVAEEVVKRMSFRDFREVIEVLSDFLSVTG